MRNPVVLFKTLTSDETISVGVIQTIHQGSNHTPNPAGSSQAIFVCLKPLGGLTQTIPTNILYHSGTKSYLCGIKLCFSRGSLGLVNTLRSGIVNKSLLV